MSPVPMSHVRTPEMAQTAADIARQGSTTSNPDAYWRAVAGDYQAPQPDIYSDLRDIMAKLGAREDADRTAMVVFIAAYYGWRLES